MEIDPEQAAQAYRERIVGPVRGLLPAAEVAAITEQLSGSCTTEIASFNEFTDLLADADGVTDRFDHVLFDTAPPGTPSGCCSCPGRGRTSWTAGTGDASCLGPAVRAGQATRHLRRGCPAHSPTRCAPGWCSSPAPRPRRWPRSPAPTPSSPPSACSRQHVVINGVLPDRLPATIRWRPAIFAREQAAIAAIPAELRAPADGHRRTQGDQLVGLDALRTHVPTTAACRAVCPSQRRRRGRPAVGADRRTRHRDHGLIMCMGKGGVGKTTTAAAIAVALAARGHDVHLSTTDPAAHLTETLQGDAENLRSRASTPTRRPAPTANRSWPPRAPHLDEQGRAGLAEDLHSPCTEEVAVFQAFSRVINESTRRFVVVDTAPTGHTLLLLDATGSYHREIARQMGERTQLHDPADAAAATPTTPRSSSSPWPSRPRCSRPHRCRPTSNAPASIRGPGSINNSLAAARPTSPLLRQRAAR